MKRILLEDYKLPRILGIDLSKNEINKIKESGFNNCITYFIVVSTLLVAGTNHLILGGHTEKRNELLNSIEKIIEWTFGDNLKDKDYN